MFFFVVGKFNLHAFLWFGMLVVMVFKTIPMNKLLILIVLGFTFSCKSHSPEVKKDNQKIDSLISVINELNNKVTKMDSALQSKNTVVSKVEVFKDSSNLIANKSLIKVEKTKPVVEPKIGLKSSNDTVLYLFDDGRISVKIFPFVEGRQSIIVFKPNGDIAFETENVQLSYHVSNDLKFRDDGSLELIKSSMNPGASLYWYESVIGFDIDNEPLYKQTFRHPYESVNDAMGEKYLWNKLERKWVKQEIIIETNLPK